MIRQAIFTIHGNTYNGYVDDELIFTKKPLLEKSEATRLMNEINAIFVDKAEMVYEEAQDNFYDDYRCWDDHSGKDYETENGIKHLYDFADNYFEKWTGKYIKALA